MCPGKHVQFFCKFHEVILMAYYTMIDFFAEIWSWCIVNKFFVSEIL